MQEWKEQNKTKQNNRKILQQTWRDKSKDTAEIRET